MLDPNGHIASCNATNFFWVTDGALCTSSGDFCFNGITRANVLALTHANGIEMRQGDFPPDALDAASEAFVTGTFGGLTPVAVIDGRRLGAVLPGPLTSRLIALYDRLKDGDA
jgi:branched-chain amino acid aminotransferase